MNKKYYVSRLVEGKHAINVFGKKVELDLTWTDGMIGVVPVFSNKKKAIKYAGKNNIMSLKEDKEFKNEK